MYRYQSKAKRIIKNQGTMKLPKKQNKALTVKPKKKVFLIINK